VLAAVGNSAAVPSAIAMQSTRFMSRSSCRVRQPGLAGT
jgi:hypothetical protein